ncbi:MAG: hypothetical protein ISF22_02630 [Methanomassiliicoccus sp.]|nr:hypothetical protein [Methanomassiliicoccus sp.]
MFGVIICPRCTLVQGADLSMARITCPRCGGKIEVKRAKVYFSTDSPKELAEAVRQVGARLVYDIEAPGAPRPQIEVSAPRTDEEAVLSAIVSISWDRRDAAREDIARALPDVDGQVLDDMISRLLEAGIIYEAAPGRYRPS